MATSITHLGQLIGHDVVTDEPADTLTAGGSSNADGLHTHNGKANASHTHSATEISPAYFTRRVATQFDKTNSTLSDVTGLSVSLSAGKTYAFRAYLFIEAGPTGPKATVGGTCTASSVRYDLTFEQFENEEAPLVSCERSNALGAILDWPGGNPSLCTIVGCITVSAAGTLTVQFAQVQSNQTPASVLVGSHLIAHEIA